jgi:hypothetical protein
MLRTQKNRHQGGEAARPPTLFGLSNPATSFFRGEHTVPEPEAWMQAVSSCPASQPLESPGWLR